MSTDDLAGKSTDITEQYTTPNASQAGPAVEWLIV